MKHGRFALAVSVAVTAAIATAVLLGISPSAAPAVGVRTAAPAYPNSIAAIGHSDTNGSGVKGPRTNWPHSSWVTGDSPAVQSLYSRILARNPAIRGNRFSMTALGRQEEWEDSPEGYPQTPPYEWWIWHDEPKRAGPVTA